MSGDGSIPRMAATQYDDRFTVHNYTALSSTRSFGAGTGSRELLDSAQRLIKASSSKCNEGWTSMKEVEVVVWVPGNLYAYNASPPLIVHENEEVSPRARVEELKEWGSPVEESEVWSLADLEDFESSDFSVVHRHLEALAPEGDGLAVEEISGAGEPVRQESSSAGQDARVRVEERQADEGHVRSQPEAEKGDAVGVGSSAQAQVEVSKKRPCPTGEETEAESGGQVTDASASASIQPPPSKRRKVDCGPLHGIIPRPHIYPSMPVDSNLPAPAVSQKPYKRTKPIYLAPYTDPLPPSSIWDRRAWIIPVRGSLPWEGCTAADVLFERDPDDQDSVPSSSSSVLPLEKPVPPAPRSLEPVFWTRGALVQFWEFLKVLRRDGKMGMLGVAFQPSAQYRSGGGLSRDGTGFGWSSEGAGGQGQFAQQEEAKRGRKGKERAKAQGYWDCDLGFGFGGSRESSFADISAASGSGQAANANVAEDAAEQSVPRLSPGLTGVDYIKVYHEAGKSMVLRTVFDVWAFQVKDGSGKVGERIRVLKGAKLVLVDHLSKGMLIS
ncbi:hypothetical protein DFP72DRAFT_1172079 [Ephemerocybe angulata]|uniref:Uncharacterized protein n=1 Tax=Ephemerocybe angulata TaxID=980116 RepID=A0A8H6M162_9AGAR|nr:hypothetical protein DFP72DRAFT_1172079 [Tulosesus angulatus]